MYDWLTFVFYGLHFVLWYAPRIVLAHTIRGMHHALDVWEDYDGEIIPNIHRYNSLCKGAYYVVSKGANFVCPEPYKSVSNFNK